MTPLYPVRSFILFAVRAAEPLMALTLCCLLINGPAAAKPSRGAEYRTIQAFTYGRFEVRMRSANVSGMLASFFTYAEISSIAEWNEIDIEIMGRYTNEVQFNTITPGQQNHVQRQVVKFNPANAFHIYAIEWTPDYVAWSIDGYEVYRQAGQHTATLTRAQKLMMNIWQPGDANWAGTFSPASLPVYATYDWVRYSTYTPGIGDNFTVQWRDDFNTFDATRWQKATHTFDGNNSVFVQNNVVFQDGYMVLCLTDSLHTGYSGAPIVDLDADPPYLVAARAYDSSVLVNFSEPLEKTSAETATNYSANITINTATLLPDTKTVQLGVSGMSLTTPFILFATGMKDLANPAHTMSLQYIRTLMPVAFPTRINVGGGAVPGYLADSVWSWNKNYGSVGGTPVTTPASVVISGTSDQDVFRAAISGITFYRVRVPAGIYNVTLMLCENQYTATSQRVFRVAIEGTTVAPSIDIFQAVGAATAYEPTFNGIQVNDGVLDLYLSPIIGPTILQGLRIERVTSEVGVNDGVPTRMKLDVYPNPFNSSTAVRYSLPRVGDVDLALYDVAGREVWRQRSSEVSPGEHVFHWDGTGFSTGLYFLSLRTHDGTMTRKVLLLR